MADQIETRRRATDAAYAFIENPEKMIIEKGNPALLFAGAVSMLFPRLEIDWGSVEMFAGAFDKLMADEDGGVEKVL